VNINTIFQPEVWCGVANYFPGTSDLRFWEKLVHSRRGYDVSVGNALGADPIQNRRAIVQRMLAIDPSGDIPTRFAVPFRSSTSGQLAPYSTTGNLDLRPPNEIDSTLLRRDPAASPDRPLFEYESESLWDDTNRNPYFRYQGLQRLGNLVTTRSNVYAVWITIGYFEVESAGPNPDRDVHPDGYRLSAELGLDTGEITRHRAFYLIDRSIPVGFRRGEDLNSENAILLKRYIE
jgi:hypothetical protein